MPKTPKTIKTLIYINVAVFILMLITRLAGIDLTVFLGVVPYLVLKHHFVWQFFTYMFVHGGVFHLLLNMLMLWMFGVELYKLWGTKFFLKYYFICGVGAGITVVLLSFITPSTMMVPTVGSSGAIFGLFLAYGLIFRDRMLFVFGVIPVRALRLVLIMGAIELAALLMQENSSISHLAHLGGLVTGFAYLKLKDMERKLRAKKFQKTTWN
ncbi:MAG: rhomboid family intramembrane serine protease [Pseudomonadota bacterium]